jgi:hypothetical protein
MSLKKVFTLPPHHSSKIPLLRYLRPKPISPDTFSTILTASRIVKESVEGLPVPGIKAVSGVIVLILEDIQVLFLCTGQCVVY